MGDSYEGTLKNGYLYNGKELFDDGDLNWYDYGFRNYDPQIGRFPQLDPLTDSYPFLTPYQYASCDPIANIDIDGLEGYDAVVRNMTGYLGKADNLGGLGSSIGSIINGISAVARIAGPVGSIANLGTNVINTTSQRNIVKQQLATKTINGGFPTGQAGKQAPIVKHQSLSPKREVVTGKVTASSLSGNSELGIPLVYGGTVAPDPRVAIIAAAAVISLYMTIGIIHMATAGDAFGYGTYNDHAVPDNTIYNRPIYTTPKEEAPPFDGQQLKAEDQTDHMGKSRGDTPGNNQAQNKQVKSLGKKYNLSDKQLERLHDRISKQGYGYKEIEQIIRNNDY